MRLLGVSLEGVGRHRGVVLDELSEGLTVVYGLNEAGKSTLLAGVRGVLFGRPEAGDVDVAVAPGALGRVWLEEGGARYAVERGLFRRSAPKVTLPDGRVVTGDSALRDVLPVLGQVEDLVYTSVFTFQLAELNDLRQSGDLAAALYAVGLVGNRSPLDVERELRDRAKALYNRRSRNSRLLQCLREVDELQRSIREAGDSEEAYRALRERLGSARSQLVALERSLAEASRKLEEARRDARAAADLRQLAELRTRLGAYADVASWSAEDERAVRDCRAALREVAAGLGPARQALAERQRQVDAVKVDEEALVMLPRLRELSDLAAHAQARLEEWASCERAVALAGRRAEEERSRLSAAWTSEVSAGALLGEWVLAAADREAGEAERLELALEESERALAGHRARASELAAAWQQRWAELSGEARALGLETPAEMPADGPDEPVWTEAERRLQRLRADVGERLEGVLDELQRLDDEERALRHRLDGAAHPGDAGAGGPGPAQRPAGDWWRWALVAALLAAALLAGWEAVRGSATGSALGVAIVLLLGAGLWRDRQERRQADRSARAEAASLRAQWEQQLADVGRRREQLRRLRRQAEAVVLGAQALDAPLSAWRAEEEAAADAECQRADLCAAQAERTVRWQTFLAEHVWPDGPALEELSPAAFAAEARAVLRLREAEREIAEHRRRQAEAAGWLMRYLADAAACLEGRDPAVRDAEGPAAEPASSTDGAGGGPPRSAGDPADARELAARFTLAAQRLRRALAYAEQQADADRRRAEGAREVQALAATVRQQEAAHERLRQRLAAHYARLGAADDEDFDRLAQRAHERRQLEEAVRQVESRLIGLYGGREAFEAGRGALDGADDEWLADRVARLQAERERLKQALDEAARTVWGIEQELSEWEQRHNAAPLRWQLAQRESERQQLAKEWAALVLAEVLTRTARLRFERTRQPAAMHAAGELFRRLTGGRYAGVIARAGRGGEPELVCTAADGREWSPGALSRGTREQLYLALRLALMRLYRGRGVVLPAILDDPMVNFDAPRLRLALEVLAEEAAGGQVLYLTCRPDLVEAAQRMPGVAVVHLPPPGDLTEGGRSDAEAVG